LVRERTEVTELDTPLAERIAERIRREGPIPFDAYVEAALYDEQDGFFTTGGGAGRAGRDFVTSPEVGSTFGALVARALDGWWEADGSPDPWFVVEAGAGRGRLAVDVLRARPACAPALRYVCVERSAVLRDAQRDALPIEPAADALGPMLAAVPDEPAEPVPGLGPIVTSIADLPDVPIDGVLLANELLDNLPFRIVEWNGAEWLELRVALEGDGFAELAVPADDHLRAEADAVVRGAPVPTGARLPVATGIADWLAAAGRLLRRGRLVVIDYADTVATVLAREPDSWLRTYARHQRGGAPLERPGDQDITSDVLIEALVADAGRAGLGLVDDRSQAAWLDGLGAAALAAEAAAVWRDRAHRGDLEAVAARSRVHEVDALIDPAGLGGHRVLVFAPPSG
jgi:SAM-dependent MidA family methyltransferase